MEARLFAEGTVPEWTTPEWYAGREAAPHLEQEGHCERLLLSADMASSVAGEPELSAVVDLGAGDGGLLSMLKSRYHVAYGYDLQQSNVDAARERDVTVFLRDVVNDLAIDELVGVDTVIATEMLEHLIDPHGFVRSLAFEDGPQYLVASSPYIETAESHYEFHTWAWDLVGYRELLENNGWRVLRQETVWISQVLLAERA